MVPLRYPKTRVVLSAHDPFADVLAWLGFLTARDYLIDLLIERHGFVRQAATARAGLIIPHVDMAMSYVKQSLDGPTELSFLPAYYAILDLMKVCVLLGPNHAALPLNRWHGASFDFASNSHSILTEVVTLRGNGVFPLFYATITSRAFTKKKLALQLRDILPYVSGVTHEYTLARGEQPHMALLAFSDRGDGERPIAQAYRPGTGTKLAVRTRDLQVLRGFRQSGNGEFEGEPLTAPREQRLSALREHLRPYLIYRTRPDACITPISSRHLHLPEELPIAVLFFYMSSIVRYKPEFFARLRDGRFWPLLSSARIHAFHSYLMAFWSYMQVENYFICAPSHT